MTDIAEIEVAGVATVLDAGGVLLDVREPEEWEAGHAPGAVHVPLGQLPDRMGELARVRRSSSSAVRAVARRSPPSG